MQTADEQLRALRENLRRDERHPDRTGPVRRGAYKRILDLAHSPEASYKKLATERIKDFFADFPDLQDQAINTIYDLCEDHDSQIRIAGYEAITSVSNADKNWLVRNADVLVQLLQSDDQEEVAVVKRAILDHINMDPDRSLQVLCDQCVFELDGLDEEEKGLRSRLRTLVIVFLANDAKTMIERVVKAKELKADEILFRGLVNAIPKATHEETALIVSNILLPASPSLKTRGPRGDELLDAVLALVGTSLRDELRSASPAEPTSLPNTQFFLRLANEIVLSARAAEPLILLRHHMSSNLVSKMTLQKLTDATQISMVAELANVWNTCDETRRDNLYPHDSLSAMRNQLVQACPVLFEPLIKSRLEDETSCTACLRLLNACQNRKGDPTWSIPTNLLVLLEEIQMAATDASKQMTGQTGTAGTQRDVLLSIQNLCRSLLDSKPKVPGMTVTPVTDLPDVSQRRFKRPEIRRPQSAANAPKGQVHGSPSSILAGPAPLSTRFSAVDTNSEGSNQGGIAGQSVGEPSSMSVGANIANKRKLDDSTTRGLPNPPANGFQRRLGKQPEQGGALGPMDDGAFSRQPKRTKKGGYSEFEGADPAGGSTPSLLSRMRAPPNGSAYQSSRPLNQRSSPMSTNTNHHHNPQRPSKTDGLGGDAFPSEDAADGGFRIKGAATQPDIVTSSSLLHRIGDDSGMGLGSLGGGPNNGFQGGDGARHKRKYKQR